MRHLKIGAFFYVLWGLLHIGAGLWLLWILRARGTPAMMTQFGLSRDASLPEGSWGVIGSLGGQHASNLAILGLLAIAVAVWTVRAESVFGYWLNLLVIGLVDLCFLIAFYLPGHMRGADGLLGPILYVLAAVFSSLGLCALRRRSTPAGGSSASVSSDDTSLRRLTP